MRWVSSTRQWLIGLSFGTLAFLASGPLVQAQSESTTKPAARADDWWVNLHKTFLERARKGNVDLLFLGDSITQGWGNNDIWQRFYDPRHAANFGIGGDRTQHVLWRLENGEIDGISPKVAVLMIGTNNVGSNSPDEIADGVKAIVKTLRTKLPKTRILLLGVFPRSEKPDGTRDRVKAVNEQIAKLDDNKTIKYRDIGKNFLNDDATISRKIMPDFLHLSHQGYRIWADAIEPTLWSMLNEHESGDDCCSPP